MSNVINFPTPRRPEVETALDRLAAHLAPTIRLSPDVEGRVRRIAEEHNFNKGAK